MHHNLPGRQTIGEKKNLRTHAPHVAISRYESKGLVFRWTQMTWGSRLMIDLPLRLQSWNYDTPMSFPDVERFNCRTILIRGNCSSSMCESQHHYPTWYSASNKYVFGSRPSDVLVTLSRLNAPDGSSLRPILSTCLRTPWHG